MRAINEIQNDSGNKNSDPKEINDSFKTFYNYLYKSEPPRDPEIQTEFLDGIQFPSLSEEERANLDVPLLLSELSDAMTSMKDGKAAGPDGIPIDI